MDIDRLSPLFCASIYPIKIIFDTTVPHLGKPLAGEWLLLMLYAVAMLSLFNFFYGIVNNMVNKLAGFNSNMVLQRSNL